MSAKLHVKSMRPAQKEKENALQLELYLDQYQYLGNCPPTPPLTQQQSIDNKLGLMLG